MSKYLFKTLDLERVAFLRNQAGSGYFKNPRTGPGWAGYSLSFENLDKTSAANNKYCFLTIAGWKGVDFQVLMDGIPLEWW